MDIFFSFRQVVDIYYDIHAGGTDNHDFLFKESAWLFELLLGSVGKWMDAAD